MAFMAFIFVLEVVHAPHVPHEVVRSQCEEIIALVWQCFLCLIKIKLAQRYNLQWRLLQAQSKNRLSYITVIVVTGSLVVEQERKQEVMQLSHTLH